MPDKINETRQIYPQNRGEERRLRACGISKFHTRGKSLTSVSFSLPNMSKTDLQIGLTDYLSYVVNSLWMMWSSGFHLVRIQSWSIDPHQGSGTSILMSIEKE